MLPIAMFNAMMLRIQTANSSHLYWLGERRAEALNQGNEYTASLLAEQQAHVAARTAKCEERLTEIRFGAVAEGNELSEPELLAISDALRGLSSGVLLHAFCEP